jgi:hypothetical protein
MQQPRPYTSVPCHRCHATGYVVERVRYASGFTSGSTGFERTYSQYDRREICTLCRGTCRVKVYKAWRPCSRCNMQGTIMAPSGGTYPSGLPRLSPTTCPTCNGSRSESYESYAPDYD